MLAEIDAWTPSFVQRLSLGAVRWDVVTVVTLAVVAGTVAGLLLHRRKAHRRASSGNAPARSRGRAARRGRAASVRWVHERMDFSSPRGFPLTIAVVAALVSASIFGLLLNDVLQRDGAVALDPGVERYWLEHRIGWATVALKASTWLGSNALLIPLVAAIAGYLALRRRDGRRAAFTIASLAGAVVLYQLAKHSVARPRPPAGIHLLHVSGSAFPSGHATAAAAVWGAAAIVFFADGPLRRKVLLGSAAAVIAAIVAFSRVYLGVHWLTDVVGGLALGGAWLACLTAFLLASPPTRRSGTSPESSCGAGGGASDPDPPVADACAMRQTSRVDDG